MFEYVKGILVDASPHHAIIESYGIGYRLLIPLSHYGKLPTFGKETLLYISTVIREDSHKHFGFVSKEERDFFEMLIEISGIGPKTGLALIGHLELSELQLAISSGNVPLLSKVPGIGKKTAERLVVEMKDKSKKLSEASLSHIKGKKDLFSDALSALVNLGYHPQQAQKAVKTALSQYEEEPALAILITAALREF